MKTVAVVPIKLNNSRLPGKNIKKFRDGMPLCWYIFTTLLSIPEIDDVYVFCSNDAIKDYLPIGVKFLKRDTRLDSDTTGILDILHSFSSIIDADIYVSSHATAPFILPSSIIKGIEAVKSGQYDSSFAAKIIQDFLWQGGKPFNYDLNKVPRTQDLEPLLMETSGFYIFKKEVLLNLNRRIGNKPYIVEVSETEAIDIDEEEDFIIADALNFYRK